MQGYDLIMLIVLGMATIFGAIKGFAWQVASLASILVSYLVAYRFRYDVAEMIQAKPPWNQFLAMLILYVGTSFVIWVGFRLLSGTIDRVRLKEFDRHLGAAFGLAKGCVYCLLITMFATSLLGPKQQAAICQSRSGYYIAKTLDHGIGILPKEIHDVVGPYLARLDAKLKSGGAFVGQTGEPGDLPEGIWPSNGLPNLENIPESLQTGIRKALPQMLPGGLGNANGGSGPTGSPTWPPDFSNSGGLPSFGQTNFAPGGVFPTTGSQSSVQAPQIYPPLGQGAGAPLPSSPVGGVPAIGSGLRPTSTGTQAAQPSWGQALPR